MASEPILSLYKSWHEETLKPALTKHPETRPFYYTTDGLPIERIYLPSAPIPFGQMDKSLPAMTAEIEVQSIDTYLQAAAQLDQALVQKLRVRPSSSNLLDILSVKNTAYSWDTTIVLTVNELVTALNNTAVKKALMSSHYDLSIQDSATQLIRFIRKPKSGISELLKLMKHQRHLTFCPVISTDSSFSDLEQCAAQILMSVVLSRELIEIGVKPSVAPQITMISLGLSTDFIGKTSALLASRLVAKLIFDIATDQVNLSVLAPRIAVSIKNDNNSPSDMIRVVYQLVSACLAQTNEVHIGTCLDSDPESVSRLVNRLRLLAIVPLETGLQADLVKGSYCFDQLTFAYAEQMLSIFHDASFLSSIDWIISPTSKQLLKEILASEEIQNA